MSHQIAVSDEMYEALAQMATASGTTPEAFAEVALQEVPDDEQAWDALTRKPGAHAFHQQLIAELDQELADGTVEDCP